MPESTKPRPWLIAAWPGMGNVAMIAAGHLISELGMNQAEDLPASGHFDVVEVDVKKGLVLPAELPRGMFFRWSNPGAGRDLVVFIGAAQPSTGSYAYANELLDAAVRLGVERVVTFASLASGLHPSENPKVSGVATDPATLDELERAEVLPIDDGQIGGLNGLILGVAAARKIAGMCLLAEIPYFAMRVPNPKASRAALSVFSVLAGIDLSLDSLNRQADIIDRALIEAIERAEKQSADESAPEGRTPHSEGEEAGSSPEEPPTETAGRSPDKEQLAPADRARIEQLFQEARKDPHQAVRLKTELDRLGVFKQFEGRFLDLFRRAG